MGGLVWWSKMSMVLGGGWTSCSYLLVAGLGLRVVLPAVCSERPHGVVSCSLL